MKQLAEIPYIDHENINGRIVHLMPLYDGESWNCPMPLENGMVVPLQVVELGEGNYLAKSPARESDLNYPFIEYLWQHASFSGLATPAQDLANDMAHLATSYAKLKLFWDVREQHGHSVGHFVATEVEYILILVRSMLDCLHKVAAALWNKNCKVFDEEEKEVERKPVPNRLSKICLEDSDGSSRPRTVAELQAKYGLVDSLVNFYARLAPFFLEVRRARNAIVHTGGEVGSIYLTEKGFAISKDSHLFRNFAGLSWKEGDHHNERVVSLKPLVAHVGLQAVYQCNHFVQAVQARFEMPPPIAPGYSVFTRIAHQEALLDMQETTRGTSRWWSDLDAEPEESR